MSSDQAHGAIYTEMGDVINTGYQAGIRSDSTFKDIPAIMGQSIQEDPITIWGHNTYDGNGVGGVGVLGTNLGNGAGVSGISYGSGNGVFGSSGGGMSSAGHYTLQSTIGQADAGEMSSGGYTLLTGYWDGNAQYDVYLPMVARMRTYNYFQQEWIRNCSWFPDFIEKTMANKNPGC